MATRFNKEFAIQIGDALRKIRVSQPEMITQADVAKYAGISSRYYTYLEAGQRIPSFEVMMNIAAAYRMSMSDFCKHFNNISI